MVPQKYSRRNKKNEGSVQSSVVNMPSKVSKKHHDESHKLKNECADMDYKETREDTMNLYRPLSPFHDETPYDSTHPTSSFDNGKCFSAMDLAHANNFIQFGTQALMFEMIPNVSPHMFDHQESYSLGAGGLNMEYPVNHYFRRNDEYVRPRHYRQRHRPSSSREGNTDHRKRSFWHNSFDCLARRVYGLTHRFLSRSFLMEILSKPPRLLNGGHYDQLSQAMYDVYMNKAQKPDTYESKIKVWRDLFLGLKGFMSHFALYIVGSTMTGFALASSDIDMCLLIRSYVEDARIDALQQLHYLQNHLSRNGMVTQSELVLAKVPILKLRESSKGFEIDLNCNNSVGIYNTHLLYSYSQCDWRVRPLVVMTRLWAQANRVNDAKNLTVSSYSWTLMIIHYLQCGVSPAVLPCLHLLCPEHFNSLRVTDVHEDLEEVQNYRSCNTQSLGELFIGFFGYYAKFDFEQYAVSIRTLSPVLIENCKRVRAPKNSQNQWKYLCIEEPFDFTNTARSVYDLAAFRHIKMVITKTYEELVKSMKLSNVLPVA